MPKKKTTTQQKNEKGITLDKEVQPVRDAFEVLIDTEDIEQAVKTLQTIYNEQENK